MAQVFPDGPRPVELSEPVESTLSCNCGPSKASVGERGPELWDPGKSLAENLAHHPQAD